MQLSTSPLDLTMLRTRRSPKYATHNDWVLVWEKRPAAEDAGEMQRLAASDFILQPVISAQPKGSTDRLLKPDVCGWVTCCSHKMKCRAAHCARIMCLYLHALKGVKSSSNSFCSAAAKDKSMHKMVLFLYFWLLNMQKKHLSLPLSTEQSE